MEAEVHGSQISSAPEVRLSNARFQEHLAEQLGAAQKALGASHEQVMKFIMKHMEHSRQAGAEVVEVCIEDEISRASEGNERTPQKTELDRPQCAQPGYRKDRGRLYTPSALSVAPRPTGIDAAEPGDGRPGSAPSKVAFLLPSNDEAVQELNIEVKSSLGTQTLRSDTQFSDYFEIDAVASHRESERQVEQEDTKASAISYSIRCTSTGSATVVASPAPGAALAPHEGSLEVRPLGTVSSSITSARGLRFELLPCWGQSMRIRSSGSDPSVRYARVIPAYADKEAAQLADNIVTKAKTGDFDFDDPEMRAYRSAEEGGRRGLIIHPYSMYRTFWDLSSLVAVIYDMITIPLQMFDPEPNWISISGAWITRLFWTIDIYMSFSTGDRKSVV